MLPNTPDLARILQDRQLLADVPPDIIPDLLAELEKLRAQLWARMLTDQPRPREGQDAQPTSDRFLTPEEAARLLGTTVRWLYRHHKHLPFARRLSRRALRFSEIGLRRWLATRSQGPTL